MSEFMLLLHYGERGPSELTPAEFQALVEDIRAWYEELDLKEAVIRSGKLRDGEGRRLSLEGGRLVVDGPYAEAKEVLGGFFLIEARDLDRATTIASGCPMLRYGGVVHVRPLDRAAVSARMTSE